MSFTQLLRILWARRQLVITTTAIAVGLAIIAFLVLPKAYIATTSLVIDARGDDPLTGTSPNMPSSKAVIATQIDVIASRAVALKVVDALKLPTDDAQAELADLPKRTRDGWASALLSHLLVKPVADSNVVRVRFEDPEPEFAA
ncbi:MAG TPA: Wzz/FepE/Etk N-terminal domain-containing protein, partial [Povalibacter sp.]